MKMDVLLYDNDPDQLAMLENDLRSLRGSRRLSITALSDENSLDDLMVRGAQFDIAIMDIDLGEGRPSGIDTVKKYFGPQSGTQVVYLTGYVEYCTEVYETDHVYFLLKPATRDQLARALEKASARLDREDTPLKIISNRKVVSILPKRIIYIETKQRRAYIHLTGGEEVVTRSGLDELRASLPPRFIQPHKSYLVNLDLVTKLDGAELRMADGSVVPISQVRRKATREAFMGYLHRRG